MIKMNKKGFTLVEIMIVVAIIGLLAAIAIPNFVRARATARARVVDANVKQVYSAIQVWAIEYGKVDADAATWGDIVTDYLKTNPNATTGSGTYTITTVGAEPTHTW
ncbi:competence type IV pilus major pilin ComGC [Candidatus Omnitrophota bacterium]